MLVDTEEDFTYDLFSDSFYHAFGHGFSTRQRIFIESKELLTRVFSGSLQSRLYSMLQ